MRPEHGQAFKGQMDAPHRLLLDEMARCQLAASMVTHDVTEAVACQCTAISMVSQPRVRLAC